MSKLETNSNDLNVNVQNGFLNFCYFDFGIVSDFVLWYSDLTKETKVFLLILLNKLQVSFIDK